VRAADKLLGIDRSHVAFTTTTPATSSSRSVLDPRRKLSETKAFVEKLFTENSEEDIGSI